MKTTLCLMLLPLGIAVGSGDAAVPGGGLEVRENDTAIVVSRNGVTVVTYNKQSPDLPQGVDHVYQRSGFLHPVGSPAGQIVTALYPADHLHQDGIFSAWVNTTWDGRKINFWDLAGETGRVLHQQVISTFSSDRTAGFEVDLRHRIVASPAVDVLNERWKVTVHEQGDSHHCFDLETTQTALTDEPLIVNQYHYGGIAARGPTAWLRPQQDRGDGAAAVPNSSSGGIAGFLNDRGSDRLRGNHEKSRWVSMTGPLNGKSVTVSVLCHPSGFRAPQSARLHPSKPYFCFAPCVEGEFVIDRRHPFQARYRYLITDAAPDSDWLDEQWHAWSAE